MPVLVYSLLRILLIVVAGAGFYLAGMRGALLVIAAVLVGAGLSYVLLDRFRRASAEWLASRGRGHTRVEDHFAADAEAEDAILDAEDSRTGSEAGAGSENHTDPDPAARAGSSDIPDAADSDQQRDQDPQSDDEF